MLQQRAQKIAPHSSITLHGVQKAKRQDFEELQAAEPKVHRQRRHQGHLNESLKPCVQVRLITQLRLLNHQKVTLIIHEVRTLIADKVHIIVV